MPILAHLDLIAIGEIGPRVSWVLQRMLLLVLIDSVILSFCGYLLIKVLLTEYDFCYRRSLSSAMNIRRQLYRGDDGDEIWSIVWCMGSAFADTHRKI